MNTILIVDDQPTERRLLYHALKQAYNVLEAGDGTAALGHVREGAVDLVLLDLHLPPDPRTPEEGIRLLGRIRMQAPSLPVIIVTGDQDRALALEMVSRGVADFLLKPASPDVLQVVVARTLERARLEAELEDLRRSAGQRMLFGGLIGESAVMKILLARLAKLAPLNTTVLLLGESGTGKSAVARAIHFESRRAARPFVVVDGATIPEALLESELFGHVRGAFTGATAEKTGRIRLADGGTLFLDEVGNLSPAAQAKLLLFLDDHVFSPVGSTDSVPVDVRLIAATNQELEPMVRQGRFREDLSYRIQVATISLPPLRDRREDIPPLAEYFLSVLGTEMGRPGARLTPAAVRLLREQPWPGNVRQLKHVLESTLAQADGEIIDAADVLLPAPAPLPAPGAGGTEEGPGRAGAAAEPGRVGTSAAGPAPEAAGAWSLPADPGPNRLREGPLKARLADYERRLLEEALARTNGNKAAAGRLLGLDENQIHYLLRKHELR